MNARGQENLKLAQNPLVAAFLEMIAEAEGADFGTLVYGGRKNNLIASRYGFDAHPATKGFLGKAKGLPNSTASGKWQFLRKTWEGLRFKLALKDFSPASQTAAAVELLRECGALPHVLNNEFETAVYKSRKIWASLPGAGYGQPERKLSALQTYFNKALTGGAAIVKGATSPQTTHPAIMIFGLIALTVILFDR